jgi:hypothetical protein
MTSNNALNKIETFVKEKIQNTSSVVITETAKGYRVNNLRVHQRQDNWIVTDSKGIDINQLHSQRLAILSAALIIKQKYQDNKIVNHLDSALMILKHDKNLFEANIHNNNKSEMFESRLSRTLGDMEQVYHQISELEKSAGFQ